MIRKSIITKIVEIDILSTIATGVVIIIIILVAPAIVKTISAYIPHDDAGDDD
jgi:hypothetical protein